MCVLIRNVSFVQEITSFGVKTGAKTSYSLHETNQEARTTKVLGKAVRSRAADPYRGGDFIGKVTLVCVWRLGGQDAQKCSG